MILEKIIENIGGIAVSGNRNAEIKGITFDSRKVKEGYLFAAIKGNSENGEKYIESALTNGACAVMVEKDSEASTGNAIRIEAENIRKALSLAACNFYGNPSQSLKLVGITGTNGKTTTATLLYRLFTKLGYSCGLLSTIENRIADKVYPAEQTTPDPVEINAMLAKMCEEGCGFCFMEVSSHSLDQERVAGLDFAVAIFSNLTHDHLDYHKTYADYIRCKKKLFDNLGKDAYALTNADDKNGEVMVQNCKASIKRYSCRSIADFSCRIIEKSLEGMMLRINGNDVWTPFIGKHNAYNLLAVYSTAVLLGADPEETLRVISTLDSVSGRLEYIKGPEDLLAIVDYAHTPDALENVLSTIRDTAGADHKICTVFGCGGDRDKTKRPEMAAVAAKYSDRTIVTSDNPRTEDPQAIINDIREGFKAEDRARTLFITDRAEAIRTAIHTAEKGTIILVAGKGHETYQIIGKTKTHFDDREIIRATFDEMTK